MHELSLCHAIADVVKSHAAGRHVEVVRVQIGMLRQVVPDSLMFSWTLVSEYEDLADAELELDLVPGEVACRSCGCDGQITSRWSVACPGCGSPDVEVLHGEEFTVTSLDVSDPADATDATNSDTSPKGVHHG